MNLILLCVGSVFLARFLEKRMKVASIAHSVLFIVIAFFFMFHSGFPIIDQAMINMIGEEYFYEFQEAIIYAEIYYGVAFSALFVMELVVYIGLCIIAILALVKGFRKLLEKTRIKHLSLVSNDYVIEQKPNISNEINYQGTYLVLAHLRN